MPEIISQLKQLITTQEDAVNDWFNSHYAQTRRLIYSSVDLRHSGHKLVPVDTNLFPAGFNLLDASAATRASEEFARYIASHHEGATSILLIPENHTRNRYYLDNIAALKAIIEQAGMQVTLGMMELDEPLELTSANESQLTMHPISRDGEMLQSNNTTPDLILVNNDLSAGSPALLNGVSQPVFPPTGMGWYQRRKTQHFETYTRVATEFGKAFNLDPWLISASFSKCGTINFRERKGLECVAINVEKTLHKVRKKYEEYGIADEPYVFIKANSGTYGMGIMTVKSPEEVFELNKDTRKKMSAIKDGVSNTEVIIQEGVPTIDEIDGKPAEPLLYLVNAQPVGCTYRVNENRDAFSNLNARGMTFQSACESDPEAPHEPQNLCPSQAIIARLATLAASQECYEPSWQI